MILGQSFVSTVPSSNDADIDTDMTVITSEQSMSELTSATGVSLNTINILVNINKDEEKAVSEYNAGTDSRVCDTNTNSSVGVGEISNPHVMSYMEMLLENPSLARQLQSVKREIKPKLYVFLLEFVFVFRNNLYICLSILFLWCIFVGLFLLMIAAVVIVVLLSQQNLNLFQKLKQLLK